MKRGFVAEDRRTAHDGSKVLDGVCGFVAGGAVSFWSSTTLTCIVDTFIVTSWKVSATTQHLPLIVSLVFHLSPTPGEQAVSRYNDRA